jgi:hypothetical protein
MNRLGAAVLVALVVGGCQSMEWGQVSTRECPPQMHRTATTEPSTHLASGGKGVAPREVTDSAGSGNFASGPGDTRLISAGWGQAPVEQQTPSSSIATPGGSGHLAAGGRGVPPRTECD